MSGSAAGPVLVIGLDMADGGLIRRWTRQGRLPHFAALAREGASLALDSTAAVLHTSTWPTFATGVLPGRHGVYYPYQPTPGRQFARTIGPNQCGASTFWHRAALGGRSCSVYDIPETFPEQGYQGRAIYDWGTWARYGKTSAVPPALLREIKARFGAYPLGYEAMRLGFDYPAGIDERLLRSVRYKSETTRWLLQRAPWDLAVVGFCETHSAGHYLWPPGAAAGDGNEPSFDRLFAVYAEVDRALAALGDGLPPNGTLIVVSGDGVRANHCGWHLLPAVLDRLGHTSRGLAPAASSPQSRRSLLGRLPGLVPAGIKRRVAASLPWQVRNRLALWAQAAGLDWSRTRAFALPSDLEGCVRINVKGREPMGIVEPGAQYEDLCQEIRAQLGELVNPATGAPAVRRVWIRNDIYPGPRQEELPDLIVTWNDAAPIAALSSPRIGIVEGVNPDTRPGTHSTAGFLMARGPDIPQQCEGRGRLVDVAATILRSTGAEPPADLDGAGLRWPRPGETLPAEPAFRAGGAG